MSNYANAQVRVRMFYQFIVSVKGSNDSIRSIGATVNEKSARLKASAFVLATGYPAEIHAARGNKLVDRYLLQTCDDCEQKLPCATIDPYAQNACVECWVARMKEVDEAYKEQKAAYHG